VHEAGVVNMEMEAPQFAAFCGRLGLRAVVMCGVLVNRLLGDQVTSTPQELAQVAENVFAVAMAFIKSRLAATAAA
jgi:uridine phosphorylase